MSGIQLADNATRENYDMMLWCCWDLGPR